jgi:hypothetical protein
VRTDTAIEWLEAYVIANEPSDAPAVTITSPADGEQVPPGFPVLAEASDDHSVARVELLVDGEVHDVDSEAPYQLNALAGVEFGSHEVEARAYDTGGQEGRTSITVAVGAACSGPDDCPGDDECRSGRCLHPLGGSCEMHAECASGMCGAIGGDGRCTTPCDPFASGDCPSGFECHMPDLPGAAGQCLPGGESSGCALPSRRPPAGGGAALLLVALGLLLRRATSSPAGRASRGRASAAAPRP